MSGTVSTGTASSGFFTGIGVSTDLLAQITAAMAVAQQAAAQIAAVTATTAAAQAQATAAVAQVTAAVSAIDAAAANANKLLSGNLAGLPTAPDGLPVGATWNNGGVISLVQP